MLWYGAIRFSVYPLFRLNISVGNREVGNREVGNREVWFAIESFEIVKKLAQFFLNFAKTTSIGAKRLSRSKHMIVRMTYKKFGRYGVSRLEEKGQWIPWIF